MTGLLLLCAGYAAQAGGFVDDSQARLEARTVYFNRDFRDGHSNSGFIPSSGHGASARSVPCRLRNATYRSNYPRWARDMDESRVIVSYNFSLF